LIRTNVKSEFSATLAVMPTNLTKDATIADSKGTTISCRPIYQPNLSITFVSSELKVTIAGNNVSIIDVTINIFLKINF
jgi:hypothetical protein